MTTKLIKIRKPNAEEKKQGAEIVFERKETKGKNRYTILACDNGMAWSQWGASTDVLGDNVDIVEKWHTGKKQGEEIVEYEKY